MHLLVPCPITEMEYRLGKSISLDMDHSVTKKITCAEDFLERLSGKPHTVAPLHW